MKHDYNNETPQEDRYAILVNDMRAAIESLPFEKPKLTAVASSVMDSQSFGALLDRAIERSSRPMKLIEAQPMQTEHPPVELKPMSRLRRRV